MNFKTIYKGAYLGDFIDMTDDQIINRLNKQYETGKYQATFTADDLNIVHNGLNATVKLAKDKDIKVA